MLKKKREGKRKQRRIRRSGRCVKEEVHTEGRQKMEIARQKKENEKERNKIKNKNRHARGNANEIRNPNM